MKISANTTKGAVPYVVRHNWVEVKEPELFNFDNIGETLEGRLLDLSMERIKDDNVLTARFELPGGAQAKLRLSFDLRQKLGKRLLGKRMLIVFDSENDATQGKGNKMKVFRVFVAPDDGATEPPFVPTDDDIPDF